MHNGNFQLELLLGFINLNTKFRVYFSDIKG